MFFVLVYTYICSALFRNLRFLGIPRKRSADMNVRTHKRWMRSSPRSSPSPSPLAQVGAAIPTVGCHSYRDPLGQPDMVRAPTVSDARHASVTARPTRNGHCRTLTHIGRAVSDTCRASDTVRARTVTGCPVQHVPWCDFYRKCTIL